MGFIQQMKSSVIKGKQMTAEEAAALSCLELDELCSAADEIREHFCGNAFDICTIINGKSGKCSENCVYCAQSEHYCTEIEEFPLLSGEFLLKEASYNEKKGILRFSVVTSGPRLSGSEFDEICKSYRMLHKHTNISVCASNGLLSLQQFKTLKASGVTRYHNNLETSRRYFPYICTTHTYEDKIRTIKNAMEAGLEVCSGGIMGLGETMEDRIDMAMDIRTLGIKSVPVNILNPIEGTPLAKMPELSYDEVLRIVALYRFILPDAAIRMAGGRRLLRDRGLGVFKSGANAAISGDMLTTSGVCIDDDLKMLNELGFEVKRI